LYAARGDGESGSYPIFLSVIVYEISDQAVAHGEKCRFCSGGNAQLGVDVLEVRRKVLRETVRSAAIRGLDKPRARRTTTSASLGVSPAGSSARRRMR
jgi:hypothetical protein